MQKLNGDNEEKDISSIRREIVKSMVFFKRKKQWGFSMWFDSKAGEFPINKEQAKKLWDIVNK